MLAIALATLGLVAASADSLPADCAGRRPSARVEAWVALRPPQKSDTVVTARVCVVTRSSADKVGSYNAELRFDSTSARLVRVEKTPGGMRAENGRQAGIVRFAGASPDGFKEGSFLTVVLRLKQRGKAPKLALSVVELNTIDGQPLLKHLVNHSAP